MTFGSAGKPGRHERLGIGQGGKPDQFRDRGKLPISLPSARTTRKSPSLPLFALFLAIASVVVADGAVGPAAAQSDRAGARRRDQRGDHASDGRPYRRCDRACRTRDDYRALMLEIDTPGGLDSSMRASSRTYSTRGCRSSCTCRRRALGPHPQGRSSPSPRTFAAMAPGTAIGAATPISGGGDDLEAKATNDARGVRPVVGPATRPQCRIRDRRGAHRRSIPPTRPIRIGAIDVLAGTIDELLAQIDGRTVQVGSQSTPWCCDTAGADVESFDMGLFRRIQQFLADPNLAFFLLSLATLGLVYELATPGTRCRRHRCRGRFRAAFVVLAVLPLDAVGVVFVVLGACCSSPKWSRRASASPQSEGPSCLRSVACSSSTMRPDSK